MGEIKKIKGKIIFKHETEANWALSNYVPEVGEKVIYDPDIRHKYPRVKYGDGISVVADLPFGVINGIEDGQGDDSVQQVGTYATGAHSFSTGFGSRAKGYGSVAEGDNTEAAGNYSHAGGAESVAEYDHSFAYGEGVKTSAENQAVVGQYNDDNNKALFIVGNGSSDTDRKNALLVKKDGTIQLGAEPKENMDAATKEYVDQAVSSGGAPDNNSNIENSANSIGGLQQIPDGVADGFDFTDKNPNATLLDTSLTGIIDYGATGNFASAFGGKSAAIGKRSHAEGTTTIAKGKYSHAEGDNSVTIGDDSHAEGYKTTAYGEASHSEGNNTVAKGAASHAEGFATDASGAQSHAEGYRTYAQGDSSHAEGSDNETIGNHSHAEGIYNISVGVNSHTEGENNQTIAANSHGEGCGNRVYKNSAHAEGMANTIGDSYEFADDPNSGRYSHAEGSYNIVRGDSAHAEGQNNVVDKGADYAHVSGTENLAKHAGAHLMGRGLVSGRQNQVVVGQYNAYDDEAMFIVGNGIDKDNPSNALVVKKDGTIEGNFGKTDDDGSKGDYLAAPISTDEYDRVPIIKRNTLGTSATDFNYSIATQGAAEGTVPIRAYSGSIRANCSNIIADELYKQGGAIVRDQMAINYGYFINKMPITVPIRLSSSGQKILMKAGHKYYISSDGCKLTNGNGITYGSFSNTIKDGLITCSSAGYADGSGINNGSTTFRAFIISVSGLTSSSGNMEVTKNGCYIENTSGGVVWIYDEGPAEDFV